jgi:hypothetical protein
MKCNANMGAKQLGCYNGEYPYRFLHTTNLFTWGFRIYDATNKYFYFLFIMLMRKINMQNKNDYAEKINIDNY